MPPSDQEPAYRLVDPSTGDIVGSFYENGSGDVEIQPSDGTQYKFAQSPSDPVDVARLQDIEGFDNIEVFEADGTFDATNVDTALVECVGGGGGGGGTVDNGTDTFQVGSGGGGGGYAKSVVDVSNDSSITITVGSGGAEASDGGDSSFGTSVIGNGGGGGQSADGQADINNGSGGGGTGDIVISGGDGDAGIASSRSYSDPIVTQTTKGGDSQLGNGAFSEIVESEKFIVLGGEAGQKYGGGGSGGVNASGIGSANTDGGLGADGIVIVRY